VDSYLHFVVLVEFEVDVGVAAVVVVAAAVVAADTVAVEFHNFLKKLLD